MSDKNDVETMKCALDVAEAVATANQVGNGQFETRLGSNNEVVSERKP